MNIETARLAMLALSRAGDRWTGRIRELPNGEVISGNAPFAVLCQLAEANRIRPIDLLASLRMTSGGVTKLIDRLEEAGLVARLDAPPQEDGRGVEIALTPDGRTALEQVLEMLAPTIEELIDELAALRDL